MIMTIKEQICDLNPDAILWDGFDGAIIGYEISLNVVIYDVDKMISIFIEGMDEDDDDDPQTTALEYLHYNVFSTHVGEYTPKHIKLFE